MYSAPLIFESEYCMESYFYHQLKKIKNFTPRKKVNKILSALYRYSIESTDKYIQNTQYVKDIRNFCARGEEEMEKYYAQKIFASCDTYQEMKRFMYFENYELLSRLEYVNLTYFCPQIKNILFLGSGPLPLSAICLVLHYRVHVTLLDMSFEACELSRKLIEKLWLLEYFHFECANAMSFTSSDSFDAVISAAMLFTQGDQTDLFENISHLHAKYFVFRSSEGKRELLYRKLSTTKLQKHFRVLLEIHPKNELVNSIVITQKRTESIKRE